MSQVPDPETSYLRGLKNGEQGKGPSPENHRHASAYMTGWHHGWQRREKAIKEAIERKEG